MMEPVHEDSLDTDLNYQFQPIPPSGPPPVDDFVGPLEEPPESPIYLYTNNGLYTVPAELLKWDLGRRCCPWRSPHRDRLEDGLVSKMFTAIGALDLQNGLRRHVPEIVVMSLPRAARTDPRRVVWCIRIAVEGNLSFGPHCIFNGRPTPDFIGHDFLHVLPWQAARDLRMMLYNASWYTGEDEHPCLSTTGSSRPSRTLPRGLADDHTGRAHAQTRGPSLHDDVQAGQRRDRHRGRA